jgi:hypothetical protein
VDRFVDRGRRGRWTFVEEIVGYAGDRFEHGGVIEGIFSYFIEGVEDAQGREHSEDLGAIARQLHYLIIEEIQLKERPHLF